MILWMTAQNQYVNELMIKEAWCIPLIILHPIFYNENLFTFEGLIGYIIIESAHKISDNETGLNPYKLKCF